VIRPWSVRNERTVVWNSIWTARTLPSLESSWPPPLVKKAKFQREASFAK
jgi:hypothetical protein